jgi:hypothetical protein
MLLLLLINVPALLVFTLSWTITLATKTLELLAKMTQSLLMDSSLKPLTFKENAELR